MITRFRCVCGKKLKTTDKNVDKGAQCPSCNRWLVVPESSTYDTTAKVMKFAKAKRTKKARRAVEKAEAKQTEQAEDAKGRVVLADSNPADLDQTRSMLHDHGYAVETATDGEHALELIRESKPDAAVLDMQLNNLGGFQVVKQLRDMQHKRNADVWQTPVLITARKTRGRDKQYAMSIGAQGYFDKPLNPAQICARLEKEINRSRGLENVSKAPEPPPSP